MTIEKAFLRSRLAQRIFWLFVVCALLPIGILASVTLWSVSGELATQGQRDLRRLSHEEGMTIYERLLGMESEMRLISRSLNQGVTPDTSPAGEAGLQLERQFAGVATVKSGEAAHVLFGKLSATFAPTAAQQAHLEAGKTYISTSECGGGKNCILLVQLLDSKKPEEGMLLAEAQTHYLVQPDDAPEGKTVCVFDESGNSLSCPEAAAAPLATRFSKNVSGRFEWSYYGETQEADYWSVFLKPAFGTDHWTVAASEARADLLAPLAHFKRIFVLVALLALWIVLLASLVQIRRNLVPLNRLSEGTRKIAAGDYGARVKIQSKDEFEELAGSFNSMALRIDRQVHLLRIQNEIDRAILSSTDVEQMVEGLLARLEKLMTYEYASVSLLDPQSPTQAVTYMASAKRGREREVRTMEISEGECKSLRENPDIKIFSHSDYPPSCILPLAAMGMGHFFVAPIVVRGRLAAILSLGDTREGVWGEEDRALARQVADQFSVALANASLVSDLKKLHWGTLLALARAVDAKSKWTAGHSERVTVVALQIGKALKLRPEELEILHRGGLLHDVGKIGIPSYVLDKPGALTESEMAQMREHVIIGARILDPVAGFQDCIPLVRQHHEWFGGGGYPDGVAGDEIHRLARILSVADCYDALISDRPYRPGMKLEKVLEIIEGGRGRKYDPEVVDAFLGIVDRLDVKWTPNGAREQREMVVV